MLVSYLQQKDVMALDAASAVHRLSLFWGAALLCMAIVGGALVPLVTGRLADATSLASSLIIPLICCLVIAGFGFFEPNKG